MMGHWQKQTELWVQPVKVASRIPQDHLLRNMSKVLALGFAPRGALRPMSPVVLDAGSNEK
jgi:hypothetical protein